MSMRKNDMKFVHAVTLVLLIAFPVLARDREAFKPDRAVVYKKVGQSELKIHVFAPPNHTASDKRPAIVFFFGTNTKLALRLQKREFGDKACDH